MTRVQRPRGFTLLEVLVAIAILGLGLTVILGSQVGLFTNASRGEHLTVATNLARCKMSELEVKLLTYGYQLTDETDDGPCCSGDDDANEGYRCSWKVERVTLPELPLSGADAGANPGGDGGLDLGPIGLLTGLNQPGGQALGDKASPTDLAKTLGNAPSPMSIAPMMMSLVYPTLKPMLEASIRKVSVTVSYKDVAKLLDHSLLSPVLAARELEAGCLLALHYDVASVCIMPHYLARCRALLLGSDVKASTTIGFPHGGHFPQGTDAPLRSATDDANLY